MSVRHNAPTHTKKEGEKKGKNMEMMQNLFILWGYEEDGDSLMKCSQGETFKSESHECRSSLNVDLKEELLQGALWRMKLVCLSG